VNERYDLSSDIATRASEPIVSLASEIESARSWGCLLYQVSVARQLINEPAEANQSHWPVDDMSLPVEFADLVLFLLLVGLKRHEPRISDNAMCMQCCT